MQGIVHNALWTLSDIGDASGDSQFREDPDFDGSTVLIGFKMERGFSENSVNIETDNFLRAVLCEVVVYALARYH